MYIASSIAVLLIILGFVALLRQKTYLDGQTLQPIEVEIPIVGKMKANYPALVFVLFGFALAIYEIQHFSPKDIAWHITGMMKADGPYTNWQDMRIRVFPKDVPKTIDPGSGRFEFDLLIPEGVSFENAVQEIDFDSVQGSGSVDTVKAFHDYEQKDKDGALTAFSETTRKYDVPLTLYPKAQQTTAEVSP